MPDDGSSERDAGGLLRRVGQFLGARRQSGPSRARHEVEGELATARADLVREWPNEEPGFQMNKAPSTAARDALQHVIRLQNELDSLPEDM